MYNGFNSQTPPLDYLKSAEPGAIFSLSHYSTVTRNMAQASARMTRDAEWMIEEDISFLQFMRHLTEHYRTSAEKQLCLFTLHRFGRQWSFIIPCPCMHLLQSLA